MMKEELGTEEAVIQKMISHPKGGYPSCIAVKSCREKCRKHAAKHYHLAMHVFGLRAQATPLWSRRKFSPEPTDRFSTVRLDNSSVVEQDCVNDIGPTPFQQHFGDLITKRAGLWSSLLLGDLGRHGTGPIYQKRSLKHQRAPKRPTRVQ
ncbi:Formamidopyrimidine-DNA glycosylase [Dissostichus eleginoides]|uniref:Formamidopyrimidine-DNA glycosylase n=1 Tax=Dissostichus eleginoides TaxID=100907 RepID=A0AAD9CSU8_DISEL|nr:Formamidopyrimidine-DNA glycosylase [Dissostichus eleginoides]